MDADSTPGARGECPWCGDPMPAPTGGPGRPRQTCGKDRCRRRNGAARAVEERHRHELDALRQQVEDAEGATIDAVRAHLDYAVRTVDGAANLNVTIDTELAQAGRQRGGAQALARFLADALRLRVAAQADRLADAARREVRQQQARLAELTRDHR